MNLLQLRDLARDILGKVNKLSAELDAAEARLQTDVGVTETDVNARQAIIDAQKAALAELQASQAGQAADVTKALSVMSDVGDHLEALHAALGNSDPSAGPSTPVMGGASGPLPPTGGTGIPLSTVPAPASSDTSGTSGGFSLIGGAPAAGPLPQSAPPSIPAPAVPVQTVAAPAAAATAPAITVVDTPHGPATLNPDTAVQAPNS